MKNIDVYTSATEKMSPAALSRLPAHIGGRGNLVYLKWKWGKFSNQYLQCTLHRIPHQVEYAKPEGLLGWRCHVINERSSQRDDGRLPRAHDNAADE